MKTTTKTNRFPYCIARTGFTLIELLVVMRKCTIEAVRNGAERLQSCVRQVVFMERGEHGRVLLHEDQHRVKTWLVAAGCLKIVVNGLRLKH